MVDQHVEPADPASSPTHRMLGPASENMLMDGCSCYSLKQFLEVVCHVGSILPLCTVKPYFLYTSISTTKYEDILNKMLLRKKMKMKKWYVN
jgi:hypothetical protein